MKTRIALASCIATIIMTTAAVAQTTASTGMALVEIDDDATVSAFGMTADGIEGLDVMVDGKKVGEIEDVLGTTATAATHVTIDFDDGAGFGDRDDVVVPLDRLMMQGQALTLSADAQAIAQMPVWND